MKRFASLLRLANRFIRHLDQRITPSSPITNEDGNRRAYNTPEDIDCGPPRRRLAWQEKENDQDRCDALTKQWMEEWQVINNWREILKTFEWQRSPFESCTDEFYLKGR